MRLVSNLSLSIHMLRCPKCSLTFLPREIQSEKCPSCHAQMGEDVRTMLSRREALNAPAARAAAPPTGRPPLWQVAAAALVPGLIGVSLYWMNRPDPAADATPKPAQIAPAVPAKEPAAPGNAAVKETKPPPAGGRP